jgi:predicted nucleotidyltransferase
VTNLQLLLQRLSDGGIEFVVIGGFAGILHGSSMVTDDLDVCAVLTGENIEKIRAALKDLKPVHRMTHGRLSFLDHPANGLPMKNLYLKTDAGVVDVLSSVLGVGEFARLRAEAVEIELFGRRVAVMSLRDLIVAKEACGREKDLLTAKELRAIEAKHAQRK